MNAVPDLDDPDALRALLFGVLLWKDPDFIRLGTQYCQYRTDADRLRAHRASPTYPHVDDPDYDGELRKAEDACRGILEQVMDLDRKRR